MRIAITGASGFLGSHLVSRLSGDGHALQAFVHDAARATSVLPLVDRYASGEITDEAALDPVMDGCEVAIHLVSNFRKAGGDRESYSLQREHFSCSDRAGRTSTRSTSTT